MLRTYVSVLAIFKASSTLFVVFYGSVRVKQSPNTEFLKLLFSIQTFQHFFQNKIQLHNGIAYI